MKTWLFLGMVEEKVFIMDERRKQTKAMEGPRLNRAMRGERGGEYEEGRGKEREGDQERNQEPRDREST